MNSSYEMLKESCSLVGLTPKPFKVIVTDSKELDILQAKGYQKRLYQPKESNHHYIGEMFDQIDEIAYINENNDKVMNLMILAHSFGHTDFLYHNNYLSEQVLNIKMKRFQHRRMFDEAVRVHGYVEVVSFLSKMNDLFNLIHVTTLDLDSLINRLNLCRSERELAKMVANEAEYFEAVSQTKIMNEGWATYHQIPLIKEAGLMSLEVGLTELQLYELPRYGLNLYKLGKAMWEEVGLKERRTIVNQYCDAQFINRYYTEDIHNEQKIAYAKGEQIERDYIKVKQQLIHSALYNGKIKVRVDEALSDSTESLTIRFQPNPNSSKQVSKLKGVLRDHFKTKLYIKPDLVKI
ncbi:spore cortex formation protein SpoVR/YcgB (stage V sporulation) [Alkalibacillus filiformis]|uniref:Spore cortex formation protein SpoVR/YcgB (Stage V sporulation) n=1 Tax=Alkalibacillus filiformis TaxID=200990 RepID=A0ABU0DT72_9BACI|nr:SpoVR family protein [Alkalibacillus filiformis]MDQ0351644.1 spore cortex formation protein SpoVR/YcgB (stage V sporulation) [Alkalibacillus filiformis]